MMNKPKSGEAAALVYAGEYRFRAGGAVPAGGRMTVSTSGYLTAAASGDYLVGRAKTAVGSGSIGIGFFNFTSPGYQVSSL